MSYINTYRNNYIKYLQEALGLGIFMLSACFFGALLESPFSSVHQIIPAPSVRRLLMGFLMGLTAFFIITSRFTSGSGAHINPAITITFLLSGKIGKKDALFYILHQFIGGTLGVMLMQSILGKMLTTQPVNSVVTVPGPQGHVIAAITEFLIAFITMLTVLHLQSRKSMARYLPYTISCLVAGWVFIAGPLSGFGMNPARSFSSAVASGTWTSFWIYTLVPPFSMITALGVYTLAKRKRKKTVPALLRSVKNIAEPFEFVL